jgi:PDZ domain
MKTNWLIPLLLGPAFLFAEEKETASLMPPGVPPFMVPTAPRAWLGLEVSKPDEAIIAHIPALPPGIGFVIRSIDKDGPAEAAGLKQLDVIWKLGEQMLVNEGQLAALLRLNKPGDEIVISGFRAGKDLEIKLKLGEAPPHKHPFSDEMMDNSILPSECKGPMRISDVNILEKRAKYSSDEGSAEVKKDGELYQVKIEDKDGAVIFEGEFSKDGPYSSIPDRWKRRVYALRRGLDHALENGLAIRQPRPRVVPPPETKP